MLIAPLQISLFQRGVSLDGVPQRYHQADDQPVCRNQAALPRPGAPNHGAEMRRSGSVEIFERAGRRLKSVHVRVNQAHAHFDEKGRTAQV